MMSLRAAVLAIVFTAGQNSALAAEQVSSSSNQSPSVSITQSSGDFVSRKDKVFAKVRVDDKKSISEVTYELRRQGDDKLVLSGNVDLGGGAKEKVFSHIAIEGEFLPVGAYYFLFYAYPKGPDKSLMSAPATYAFVVLEKK